MFKSEIDIRESLSLDSLGRINNKNGRLDSLEGAGNFIGKINVAGRVDKIEFEALPTHRNRGELNRDSLFSLEIHGIKKLGLHLAFRDGSSEFHHAVGKSGLSVVDMRDDAKITDFFGIHERNYNINPLIRRGLLKDREKEGADENTDDNREDGDDFHMEAEDFRLV